MKMFETPVIEIEKFAIGDVITASDGFGEDDPNGGGWA